MRRKIQQDEKGLCILTIFCTFFFSRYQIGKAVKVAETGAVDENDPLRFKANPGNLVSKLGDDDDEDEDEDEDDEEEGGDSKGKKERSAGKYVAPKNVPAYFDEEEGGGGDDEEGGRGGRRKERERQQRLSRSLMDDLRRQHADAPEEVLEREDVARRRQLQAARERQRFEEDNFTRLPMTKKARKELGGRGGRGGMSTVGSIGDEVTAFGRSYFSSSSAAEGGGGEGRGRKRKGKGKKGAGRKRFKKK